MPSGSWATRFIFTARWVADVCPSILIGLEKLVLHYWCTKKLFNDKKRWCLQSYQEKYRRHVTYGTAPLFCEAGHGRAGVWSSVLGGYCLASGGRFWTPWGSTFPFWDGIFKHQLLINHAKRFEGVGCFPSFGVVRRSLFGNQKKTSISTAAFHRVPQCQWGTGNGMDDLHSWCLQRGQAPLSYLYGYLVMKISWKNGTGWGSLSLKNHIYNKMDEDGWGWMSYDEVFKPLRLASDEF